MKTKSHSISGAFVFTLLGAFAEKGIQVEE